MHSLTAASFRTWRGWVKNHCVGPGFVELSGIEPLTSALRTQRSPSWAIAPFQWSIIKDHWTIGLMSIPKCLQIYNFSYSQSNFRIVLILLSGTLRSHIEPQCVSEKAESREAESRYLEIKLAKYQQISEFLILGHYSLPYFLHSAFCFLRSFPIYSFTVIDLLDVCHLIEWWDFSWLIL